MKWSNILRHFVLVFLLFLTSFQLVADDGMTDTISIAAPLSAPFAFEDELGEPQGFLIELFYLVEIKTGLKTNITIMPWARAMHEVKVGRIDALMPAFYTKERAEIFVYPKLPLAESSTVFLKRAQDDIVIDDITQLGEDKLIVKVRSMSMGQVFDDAQRARKIKVVEVNDYYQGIQMLVNSRVDLFASIDYISMFLLKKRNLFDKVDILKYSTETIPSFLVFSQSFAKQNDVNVFMEKVYEVHDTKEYKALVNKFLK